MKVSFQKLYFLGLLFGLSFMTSCVDTEIEPPPTTGTELEVMGNTTIDELKGRYIPGRLTVIEDSLFVQGIVVGNDAGGNFFRSLIVQDSTAGIEVRINLTDAFNLFPLGREITIDCQGLVLGEFNGVIQLGGYIYTEGGFEQLGDIVDFNDRIYRGELVGEPEPAVRTISSLGPDDISTLIMLENVEFASSELGLTFADAFGRQTLNRTLQNCSGNSIVVRTSGFADFAIDTLPEGNGPIMAIYNVFGDTKQLFLRNAQDAAGMTGNRCNAGTGEEELMTIRELRNLYKDGAATAPDNRKIRGIVISDQENGNFDDRVLVLQDESAGVTIFFQNAHSFDLGDEVEVVVSNQELSEFNSLLQVAGVNTDLASVVGAGTPAVREATIEELLDNAEEWESTLVQLSGVTISGSSTFNGSTTVSDATGSIDMFTRGSASFSSAAVPNGTIEQMTAIVSQFNDYQLLIRNLEDVGEEDTSGGDPEQISLAELRSLFESGSGAVPANSFVRGVVISDRDAQNITGRNLVLQDETGGIVLRFEDNHNFSLGEEIEVGVSGDELSEFNGLLQINNIANSDAVSLGNTTPPDPRPATVQEVLDNAEAWESTLVLITDIEFQGGGTFEGAQTLQDNTGSIVTFTRSQASFAGSSVPDGPFTLTAIVSEFNDPQLTIRNLNDIEQ